MILLACLDNPEKSLRRDNSSDNLREEFELYHKTLQRQEKYLQILVDANNLEASTETIFQYFLQLLVVLVVRNATHVRCILIYNDITVHYLILLHNAESFHIIASRKAWKRYFSRTKLASSSTFH